MGISLGKGTIYTCAFVLHISVFKFDSLKSFSLNDLVYKKDVKGEYKNPRTRENHREKI